MNKQTASVLLADANFCTLPILSSLKKQLYSVAVCGNLPDDPCHNYSDKSYIFDYSNKHELLQRVREGGYSYLVSGCNDISYLSCAWVAEQAGLVGYDTYETVLTLHHKDKFRKYATDNGYPTPKAGYLLEDVEKFNYPLIVKPIDAFSGRGIKKINHESELVNALNVAKSFSVGQQAIVEEFKAGTLHSHSAFIRNGQIEVDFFVDEYCTVYEYQVNSSSLTTKINETVQNRIRDCITQLVKDLNLVDGLLHTQLLVDGNEFWLIEITRRCPGDLYSRLIELSTGFNYCEAYTSGFLGKVVESQNYNKSIRHFARHTVSSNRANNFFSINHSLDVLHSEVIQLKLCGKPLREAPFDKTSIIFLEFSTEKNKEILTPELKKHVRITSLDYLQAN